MDHTSGLVAMFELYQVLSTNTIENSSRAFIRNGSESSVVFGDYQLRLLCSKYDAKEDVSHLKFSPNAALLAVGTHDNNIYLYSCLMTTETLQANSAAKLTLLKRLQGHSSYITHLDWSFDSRLLKSTCGACQLLFWDIAAGRQLLSSSDALESDTQWATETCTLGFSVMGIWPKNADGTDINAVDVQTSARLVATADDFGKVKVFNYPCVAKHAPSVAMSGHCSHVVGVKFLPTKCKFNFSFILFLFILLLMMHFYANFSIFSYNYRRLSLSGWS